ncbi:MAG: hypothetical protein K6C10_04215 [Prevotella sp.]|nr:hypothetical protein [Prevotella sp.]
MTNGKKRALKRHFILLAVLLWSLSTTAQTDTTKIAADTIANFATEELAAEEAMPFDTLNAKLPKVKQKRDWATWRPDPNRALWLALVLPGAGQIYNHKYWKLPIVYGGFVGCAYAMRWNNQMYHDYSQAYMDLMDDDPNTESYNQFMHLGAQINSNNLSRYQNLFKKRKDRFRRWRDMSFFVMVGVYALSVIDAYVDASLSEFDISEDLSLHVAPAVINSHSENNPLRSAGVGMQCSLNF